MEAPYNQLPVSNYKAKENKFKFYTHSLPVDSVVVSAGERYDVVLNADQAASTYWIRFHGLMDCGGKKVFQGAILRYSGSVLHEPIDDLSYENTVRDGKVRG